MVHNPKHKVHSFRGLLGDGGQDEINLERSNLNLAYRVIKFQGFPNLPATVDQESVLLLWREEQTSIPTSAPEVDFTNQDLLAAAYYVGMNSTYGYSSDIVVFDTTLFSRNIFVTHTEGVGSFKQNYYIEIEEVPVTAATLMQLKLGVARKLNLSESAPDA